MIRPRGLRFESGTADNGRLVLIREGGSAAVCGVVMVKGVSLVDNDDSTFDLVFDGS